ncbi:hypothetical protein GLOIN_2v1885624 [Rhizophagus clarus]|uniref:Uncharacterized protein n=1 Tax=Rhizophagus clarus TaxID=94130 RepID=A0A8H3M0T6_9GLOM|nr:hypothetical protein GLOIN_2v1885624 [Rhizophagus clarus]
MASINRKQCSKCYQRFDTTFFTSQTGRELETCVSCRKKPVILYKAHNSNSKNQLKHLHWNDIKKKLYDKIIEIGNNEYLENKENGILFSCILIMKNELLDKKPCNIAKQVAKLVKQAYYVSLQLLEYVHDADNQLKSAKLLLEEYSYEIILLNIEDKINMLGFEFYLTIRQSDGTNFALAYLLLDSIKKNNGIIGI